MKKYLFLLVTTLLITNACIADDDITPIGHFSAWRAFQGTKDGKKTCFMVATPLHTSQKREDTYLMIARHPDENHYNEIVVMLGAPYHKTSKPTIGVDNNKVIEMFTDKDKSFVEKTLTEKDLINKMISGNVVRTIGKSQKGTILKDTYSLKGFTKALNAITEECP